jgi:hypothetical protein
MRANQKWIKTEEVTSVLNLLPQITRISQILSPVHLSEGLFTSRIKKSHAGSLNKLGALPPTCVEDEDMFCKESFNGASFVY